MNFASGDACTQNDFEGADISHGYLYHRVFAQGEKREFSFAYNYMNFRTPIVWTSVIRNLQKSVFYYAWKTTIGPKGLWHTACHGFYHLKVLGCLTPSESVVEDLGVTKIRILSMRRFVYFSIDKPRAPEY